MYLAVEEAAGLVDTACSRERMWPALTAFEDLIVSPVVFNTVAGGGLSFDFTTPLSAGDPYEHALAHHLVQETHHPVRALFSQVQERLPVHSYGVDYGIGGHFNKTYAFFAMGDLQSLAHLAGIPAMPPGLAAHLDTFTRYGLDAKVSALAVDYARRTWNVYFNALSAQHLERGTVRAMLRDFGLPEPSEQMLDFAGASGALYPTFAWDSPRVERICFSLRTTDPAALAPHIEPRLEKLARNAPYTYDGERVLVYAGALAPGKEYYKLATYHQMVSAAHDRVRPAS
ncbi:aromatic prenyltransferase [Streptomyces sp. NPDC093510]|uniref:aromatic prenyltransferase n=1 Tax=Streptomyces sp. NPDC093510 TaxID=3155199 RepID=UPI003442E877